MRYFTAADVVETLYRGLANNSVGEVIDRLLRSSLVLVDELGFAPLDDTGGPILLLRSSRRPMNPDRWTLFPLAVRVLVTVLSEHTTAVSMLGRLLHDCHIAVRNGGSYLIRRARAKEGTRLSTN